MEYNIIEFQTEKEAKDYVAALDLSARTYFQSIGYSIDGNGIIGKNAQTGKDEPESAHSVTWDRVHESPVGTFYVSSPRQHLSYAMAAQGIIHSGVEKDFPKEWIKKDNII